MSELLVIWRANGANIGPLVPNPTSRFRVIVLERKAKHLGFKAEPNMFGSAMFGSAKPNMFGVRSIPMKGDVGGVRNAQRDVL